MKTQIRRNGTAIVVEMEGRIDYESQAPFRESLHRLVAPRTDSTPQLVLDMRKLEFVGSSGISNFVQTLREIHNSSQIKPRLCNVGSEFQKILRAFDDDKTFEFFEDEARAVRSFDN